MGIIEDVKEVIRLYDKDSDEIKKYEEAMRMFDELVEKGLVERRVYNLADFSQIGRDRLRVECYTGP
jgi:hypothetical protein